MTQTHPALIVINVLMTVFAILIAIVYFKSKLLHSYPYYFNILFILSLIFLSWDVYFILFAESKD